MPTAWWIVEGVPVVETGKNPTGLLIFVVVVQGLFVRMHYQRQLQLTR